MKSEAWLVRSMGAANSAGWAADCNQLSVPLRVPPLCHCAVRTDPCKRAEQW